MHELHSSARELWAHPPLGVPDENKITYIKQPPTTPKRLAVTIVVHIQFVLV